MFNSGHWAAAYINSLEKAGGNVEDGITILGILASWAKSLPGEVFGSFAAVKLEMLVRKGVSEKNGVFSPALETSLRFFVLMVKKNKLKYIDPVIREINKLFEGKNGVLPVFVEYAFPPGKEFEVRIKEALKKQTGAQKVEYSGQVNRELIGGYRLRIGDTVIDASIRSQLNKLEALLASPAIGGN